MESLRERGQQDQQPRRINSVCGKKQIQYACFLSQTHFRREKFGNKNQSERAWHINSQEKKPFCEQTFSLSSGVWGGRNLLQPLDVSSLEYTNILCRLVTHLACTKICINYWECRHNTALVHRPMTLYIYIRQCPIQNYNCREDWMLYLQHLRPCSLPQFKINWHIILLKKITDHF